MNDDLTSVERESNGPVPGGAPPLAGALTLGPLTISPPVMLAPMAGVTSWPVRLICRRLGARLTFTEMVPAVAIARQKVQADVFNALKTHPDDRPLGIQLFGPDPAEMAEAARRLAAFEADLIDLNMGCPVRKIVKNGAGAALMQDLPRAARMIREVRAAITVPLTVKMRLGWDADRKNAVELARICEAEGADAITVHGRTRAQGFAGPPDLEGIREVVEAVRIPVIGNGGIHALHDARRMMEITGCAGVMVARGAKGNPWIFAALAEGDGSPRARPSIEAKREAVLLHYAYMRDFFPTSKAVLEMRKHLAWYSRGLPRAAELRRALQDLHDPRAFLDLIDAHFAPAPSGEEGPSEGAPA